MLSAPQGWPPPAYQAEPLPQSLLFRIPCLGRFFRCLYRWGRVATYRAEVLFPLEQELTNSIINRPAADLTSLSLTERRILSLLASAFRDSRGVGEIPPIHLDDQLELLCWASDDVTVVQFKLLFQREFKLHLVQEEMWDVVSANGAVVLDLVQFCSSKLAMSASRQN